MFAFLNLKSSTSLMLCECAFSGMYMMSSQLAIAGATT